MPSTLASTTRRRSGDDLAVVLVKHGCVLSRTTSNNRIWGCCRPGTELTTGNSGVKSWKQRRSCRGMLHDDDDGFYYGRLVFPLSGKNLPTLHHWFHFLTQLKPYSIKEPGPDVQDISRFVLRKIDRKFVTFSTYDLSYNIVTMS